MRARSRHNGFTLPEVLAAVTILSLVILMIYASWAALLRVTESSAVAAEHTQRERVAIQVIKEALGGASWYENRAEGPLELEAGEPFSRLKIITRVPPSFWGGRALGGHPLRRIEFVTEETTTGEHRLVMVQQALLAEVDSGQVHRTVLLPKVEEFSIEVQAGRPTHPVLLGGVQLELSEAQQQQIATLRKDHNSALHKLYQNEELSVQDRRDQMRDLSQLFQEGIEAVYTPEQKAKLAETENQWESVWGLTNRAPGGLPARARVSLGAIKEFPRRMQFPVFASLAPHAKGPPGIGTVTNIAGITFEKLGFNIPQSDDARLAFLIDKSGSMRGGKLEMVKRGLRASLNAMGGKGKFYVYFFNRSSDPMRVNLNPESYGIRAPMMLDAKAENIAKIENWIDSRKAGGWPGTNPSDSLKSAFTHEPSHLFLLTDGQFVLPSGSREFTDITPMVGDLIKSLNSAKETQINTLAVGDPLKGTVTEAGLMIIARQNGGTYTFIDPSASGSDSLFSAPPAPAAGPAPTTKNP
jgi:prepilin-type N-terminal cleavage/methylation domain-containing protein